MSRKKERRVWMRTRMILLTTCILCLLSGCQSTNKEEVKGHTALIQKEESKQAKDNDIDKGKETNLEVKKEPVLKENIKQTGETAGILCGDTILNVVVKEVEKEKIFKGKKFDKTEKERLSWNQIETDEKGNITDAHTYIWLNIEVENTGKRDVKWTPANFSLVKINSDRTLEQVEEGGMEPVYIDGIQDSKTEKDAFFMNIKAGQAQKILLGFAVNDSVSKERLGCFTSPDGDSPDQPSEGSAVIELGTDK